MKMMYVKSLIVSSVVLIAGVVGCGKSSGGSSSQPQGDSGSGSSPKSSDPFVGTWNALAGDTLTISNRGSHYELNYYGQGTTTNEYCHLSNSKTLTCDGGDLVVYNAADSTLTVTMAFPSQTTTFYQSGHLPPDPALNFLHTFKNDQGFVTISRDKINGTWLYAVSCGDNTPPYEYHLNFSAISSTQIEAKEGHFDTGFDVFHATYDINAKTLLFHRFFMAGSCSIHEGDTFTLSK